LIAAAQAGEALKLYRVVLNSGIQWNSDFEIMERAIKLRDALTLYQDYFVQLGEMESVDSLTSSD